MEVGLDQGGGWGFLSSGRRDDRTTGLYPHSGTMCMVWDTGEAVVPWLLEGEGD